MRVGLIVSSIIVISIGRYLTLTIIGSLIGLPIMLIGFIMMIIGLFSSNNSIIFEAHSNPTTNNPKIRKTEALIQCPDCNKWNSIDALFCSSCGTKLI